MKASRRLLSILFLLTALIACSSKKKHKSDTKANDPQTKTQSHKTVAQDVEQAQFTTLNGKKISISDYKGKLVVLDFWATWCKPCVKSLPAMSKVQKEFPNKLKIIAVNPGFTDTKKDLQSFASNHDYDLTYAIDSNNLHQKLHIRGIPYKVYINPQGKFIKHTMGSHGPRGDYRHVKRMVKKYTSHQKKHTKTHS